MQANFEITLFISTCELCFVCSNVLQQIFVSQSWLLLIFHGTTVTDLITLQAWAVLYYLGECSKIRISKLYKLFLNVLPYTLNFMHIHYIFSVETFSSIETPNYRYFCLLTSLEKLPSRFYTENSNLKMSVLHFKHCYTVSCGPWSLSVRNCDSVTSVDIQDHMQ